MKNFTPRRQLPKLQLWNFLAKFLTEKKSLMKALTFARRKHLDHQDEIIKSIFSNK